MGQLSSSAQRLQDALLARGFANQVIEHAETTRSAQDAANAVGCAVAQIVKSLIFRGRESGRALLVLASGVNRVDENLLAALVGEAVEKPNAAFVLETTGFVIGGVPPLGHSPAPLETWVDEDLLLLDEVWAAGGTPNAVFRATPDDLLRMTNGRAARIKQTG